MLYTAVLIACLAGVTPFGRGPLPDGCRAHEMFVNGGANPMSAFLEAQNRAAEWLAQHPGYEKRSLTLKAGRAA